MSLFEQQILKYPRTRHLEDSRLQPGDEGMGGVPFSVLRQEGCTVAIEEKVDGGNLGFRFDGAGDPYAQSRGHYLNLYDRSIEEEKDFNLLKDWLLTHRDTLLDRFEDRYVVYLENLAIAHTVFYDRLPHFFLEFDIYDLAEGCFLDTPSRRALCEGLPIVPVPVLYQGRARSLGHLKSLVGPSCFQTPFVEGVSDWRPNLRRACSLVRDDYGRRMEKVSQSNRMEGVYIKVERDGRVVDRLKWVDPDFRQAIEAADEHWKSRFQLPNLLDGPTDVFPEFLARAPDAPATYDPDRPWLSAPWITAAGMDHADDNQPQALPGRRGF